MGRTVAPCMLPELPPLKCNHAFRWSHCSCPLTFTSLAHEPRVWVELPAAACYSRSTAVHSGMAVSLCGSHRPRPGQGSCTRVRMQVTLLCSQLRWRDRLGSSSSGECRKGTSSMEAACPCLAMPQERTMWLAQAASCGCSGLHSASPKSAGNAGAWCQTNAHGAKAWCLQAASCACNGLHSMRQTSASACRVLGPGIQPC